MTDSHSDALVFFGATGDLAYKKIFPALQAMVKRGHLNVPVIGVANAGWGLDQLKARAKDSVEKHGGLDLAPFAMGNASEVVQAEANFVSSTNEEEGFAYAMEKFVLTNSKPIANSLYS
jgi:glucose-6-phosphate 1-dehydrogenase